MNSSIGRCLIGLVFAGAASIANASLIGSTVYGFAGYAGSLNIFSLSVGETRAPVPAVVGDGVDFFGSIESGPAPGAWEVAADFTSDTLTISITNNTNSARPIFLRGATDWFFGSQDWLATGGITGLVRTENSFEIEPFVEFDDANLKIVTTDGEFAIGQTKQAVYEIQTHQGTAPVPATLALFCLGLAGLGWTRHKKA